MSSDFYKAFEDKFRGSRELIKSRLRVYLPFITPLLSIDSDQKNAIDLGCGRGEWLEILKEAGFTGQGVDLDEGMLSACHSLGLNAKKADAIATLKALPDESQLVVSGFHIAEHLPFDDLQILVKEALRVLRPAGLLILETPNPENIVVGTSSFYSDPTHLRPLPPQLLAFLPEYYGYGRVKTLRLQENKELTDPSRFVSLMDVLTGVSPDYAMIAQKTGCESLETLIHTPFSKESGVTLHGLASRFETRNLDIVNQITEIRHSTQHLVIQACHTQSKTEQATAQANRAESLALESTEKASRAEDLAQKAIDQVDRVTNLFRQITARSEHAEAQARQLENNLRAMRESHSWHITAPLRFASHQAKRLKEEGVIARSKTVARRVIRSAVFRLFSFVNAHPSLKKSCVAFMKKIKLYQLLKSTYIKLFPLNPLVIFSPSFSSTEKKECLLPTRTMEIYLELKKEITHSKNKGSD